MCSFHPTLNYGVLNSKNPTKPVGERSLKIHKFSFGVFFNTYLLVTQLHINAI